VPKKYKTHLPEHHLTVGINSGLLKTSLLALESPRARRHGCATTTGATSVRGLQGIEVHSIKLPWRLCKCKRALQ